MFTVSEYTRDPTRADADLKCELSFQDRENAFDVAKHNSLAGRYLAVYAADGEQLAGFVDGKQVY